ncbi:hypothetical protein Rsub_11566 [Raphidocelis subcapitata]|uniref:Uncharacterized protein n=1 Tax=Raphidocelis subcapitata TaxID=307507 RepID=A0A2V0PM77_9CHLO|nr:hypothetical protein Rsub_11566 [Raphidocelis subcapitata]|eukprot:GBF98980.1 hypothetical protein Rsub_11566 [Raphidocelis subcapitata]
MAARAAQSGRRQARRPRQRAAVPAAARAATALWLIIAAAAAAHPYDPHAPSPPPFFEGWFLRATVAPYNQTAAAAGGGTGDRGAGAAAPPRLAAAAVGLGRVLPSPDGGGGGGDPAVACFLILQPSGASSGGDESAFGGGDEAPPPQQLPPPIVRALYFETLSLAPGRAPPPLGPDASGPAFVAEAAGGGGRCRLEVSGALVSLEARAGDVELRLETASPPGAAAPPLVPWRGPGGSPEGWAEGVIGATLGVHWYVYTLATPARLEASFPWQPPQQPPAVLQQEQSLGPAAAAAAAAGAGGAAPAVAELRRRLAAAVPWRLPLAPPPPQQQQQQQQQQQRQQLLPPPLARVSAQAFLHAEKNWGAKFPPSYVWVQAASPDGASTLALAGGPPPPPLSAAPPLLALSLRAAGGVAVEFDALEPALPLAFEPDGCGGTLAVRLRSGAHLVVLTVAAPRGSFAPLPCPEASGFRSCTEQSHAASARARVYAAAGPLDPFGRDELIADVAFDQAALEFGGAYRCG